MAVSMSSAEATPSASRCRASRSTANCSRLPTKPGHVVAHQDRPLAQAPARRPSAAAAVASAVWSPLDDLDQRDDVRRVPEVQAGDPARAAAWRRPCRDRQARGVGGQHGARGHTSSRRRNVCCFSGQVLGDGLDHQLHARAGLFEAARTGAMRAQGRRGVRAESSLAARRPSCAARSSARPRSQQLGRSDRPAARRSRPGRTGRRCRRPSSRRRSRPPGRCRRLSSGASCVLADGLGAQMRRPAAVDHQRVPGDQVGGRAGQEDHRADHVLRLAHAAQRDPLQQVLAQDGIVEGRLRERRQDEGRGRRR